MLDRLRGIPLGSVTTRLSTPYEMKQQQLISDFPRVELKFKITLDREFFALKLICNKNLHGVKFFTFCSIWEIFLTVDSYNRGKHLEHS